MRRSLLAVAALLGVAVGHNRADYVIIMANVGQDKDNQAGAMGAAGMMGAAGVPGVPGPGGFGGNFGMRGGPPGGALGQFGAAGMGGSPPGGALGQFGNLGMGGGPPGVGAFGARGMSSGPPGAGAFGVMGFGGGAAPSSPSTVRVMAVVEVRGKITDRAIQLKQPMYVEHKWGRSHLWGQDVELRLLRQHDGRILPTVHARFEQRLTKITKGVKPSTQDQIDLAEWALQHGLLTEFDTVMTGLGKTDPTHPSVEAFLKVKADMARRLSGDSEAENLRKLVFPSYHIATGDHYALILPQRTPRDGVEVRTRLRRLEETFTAFYFWHALKGKALTVPAERLPAVLESGNDAADAFARDNKIFDSAPISADSFYVPRYNVVVFSSRRLDQPYEILARKTKPLWDKVRKNDILKPKAVLPRGTTTAQYYSAQTLALLTKALDADGEVAAATDSGMRQLLVGSGLLPRHVELPQWLQSGAGSLFQTPYASPWRSYGAPHWAHRFSYRALEKDSKLPDSAFDLLRDIVTDKYFREGKKTKPSVKARATAWALTYYLAQKNLTGLHNFYKELSRLPRDLELGDEVVLDCFARAFGCVDRNNKRVDAELVKLANAWKGAMAEVQMDAEAQPMLEEIYKLQNELKDELAESNKARPGAGGTTGFSGGAGPPGIPPGFRPPGGGRGPGGS